MSFKYRRHHSYPESILIRDFMDKVNVNEIIASWEYLLGYNLLDDKIKGVINNLSGCNVQMDMDSFKTLIEYLKTKDDLKKLKLAVICDQPQVIVFPLMGELQEHSLQIKTFTTEEAAAEWIIYN